MILKNAYGYVVWEGRVDLSHRGKVDYFTTHRSMGSIDNTVESFLRSCQLKNLSFSGIEEVQDELEDLVQYAV